MKDRWKRNFYGFFGIIGKLTFVACALKEKDYKWLLTVWIKWFNFGGKVGQNKVQRILIVFVAKSGPSLFEMRLIYFLFFSVMMPSFSFLRFGDKFV